MMAALQTGLHWEWNHKKWPHARVCIQIPNCTKFVQIQKRKQTRGGIAQKYEEKRKNQGPMGPIPDQEFCLDSTLASVWECGKMEGSWVHGNTKSDVFKM